MKRLSAALAIACLALATTPAFAWEPETTHAGLAEQAALASKLHKRLVSLGFSGGLFEPMTIPPADAPTLIAAVRLLSPTHGAVPDARGRQAALSWISAGAALADLPASHGANHFFDPQTQRGWQAPERSVLEGISDKAREAIGRADLPELPAGKLDVEGEAPLDAAQRELAEEIGRAAEEWELLRSFYPSVGVNRETVHVYRASGLSTAHADSGEHERIEVVAWPLADLDGALAATKDAKTIIGLLLLREHLRGA